jgi:hypothetical protein
MDRTTVCERLEQARRHVEAGERHISRQREIVSELERDGREADRTGRLLATFEELQKIHLEDRDRPERECAINPE